MRMSTWPNRQARVKRQILSRPEAALLLLVVQQASSRLLLRISLIHP